MIEFLDQIGESLAAGRSVAVATVVRTWQSAPRHPGSAMVVFDDGQVLGSVSGGCVEAAVYELAQDVLAGAPAQSVRFGVADQDAIAVGLTCGGTIELFIQRLLPAAAEEIATLTQAVAQGEAIAVATVVAGRDLCGDRLLVWRDAAVASHGSLGSKRLDAAATDDTRGLLSTGRTTTLHLGLDGERLDDDLTIFVESFLPPPELYIFGATDFARALAQLGKYLGYRVTVCDARGVFATTVRFPEADEVVVRWPHKFLADAPIDERTAICVLTHDPKFDIPLLEYALRSPAGYVGAMGSRATTADRAERLRERGLSATELARLRGPLGLDLGARTPQETAVSIAAELIATRWGGTGAPLFAIDSRIQEDGRSSEDGRVQADVRRAGERGER